MSKQKILFGAVTVAFLATLALPAHADIRPAQVYRAEQLANTDVTLSDGDIQAAIQRDAFNRAVVEKDAATLQTLIGTDRTELFSESQAPKSWTEFHKAFLERKVKDHEITPSYGGGPTLGPF